MSCCNQDTITDAAFAHLAGIHTLEMRSCRQRTITDAAFARLAGIRYLRINGCDQDAISDDVRKWAAQYPVPPWG
jgi:hypothetical protein